MKNLRQLYKNSNSQSGFTLIEIMLVLVLLGLILSIVGPRVTNALFSGQTKAAKIQIKQIEGYLDRYQIDCNFYPTTDQGLKALVSKPTAGRPCPNYGVMGYAAGKKVPKDPWGNDFVYRCEDGRNYEIISLGADGVEGGEGENADLTSVEDEPGSPE